MRDLLGKGGDQLWLYANGLDTEPVRKWGDAPEIKSVSRGMTFKRDLVTQLSHNEKHEKERNRLKK